ncbi:MAG: 3'-5' exonuclease [Akkermansiaceae bacterium]
MEKAEKGSHTDGSATTAHAGALPIVTISKLTDPRIAMSKPEHHRRDPKKEDLGQPRQRTRLMAPTKAETALLPPFQGVAVEHIHVPKSQADCQAAVQEILEAGVGGFDTEAKPTFRKGQKSDGPHVVQFALTDKAFIFQLHRSECEKAAADIIASKRVLKVGFGLKNDHGQIRDRLGISLNHVLDLDQVFRKMGYRGQIGVRGAMGVLLNQCFKKSKSTTTSNWALPRLSSRQLTYAANDAYAALKIMEALQTSGHLES